MSENKEVIAYTSDVEDMAKLPSSPASGHLAEFGESGFLADSGVPSASLVTLNYVDSAVDASVQSHIGSVSAATKGVYALSAYESAPWSEGAEYHQGDFCMYGGNGYQCLQDHTSSSAFDSSKWDMVLTGAGFQSIHAALGGFVGFGDIASTWSASEYYSVGQLVIKDGVLKVCTSAGRGGASAQFSPGTVDGAVSLRAPYRLSSPAGTASDTPGVTEFLLSDRSLNIVKASPTQGEGIRLVPPPIVHVDQPLYFYVVFDMGSNASWDVPVSIDGTLVDCMGSSVAISIPSNRKTTYGFVQIADAESEHRNVFMATLAADPSHGRIAEIESALDHILEEAASA